MNKPTETVADKVETATASLKSSSTMLPIACVLAAIALYGWAYSKTTSYLGDSDTWESIQTQLPGIITPAFFAGLILFFGLGFYVMQMQNRESVLYIVLGMACFALSFSYISIALAVVRVAS
jgi:hypothetical protein